MGGTTSGPNPEPPRLRGPRRRRLPLPSSARKSERARNRLTAAIETERRASGRVTTSVLLVGIQVTVIPVGIVHVEPLSKPLAIGLRVVQVVVIVVVVCLLVAWRAGRPVYSYRSCGRARGSFSCRCQSAGIPAVVTRSAEQAAVGTGQVGVTWPLNIIGPGRPCIDMDNGESMLSPLYLGLPRRVHENLFCQLHLKKNVLINSNIGG